MNPKLGFACLFLLSCISNVTPTLAQTNTSSPIDATTLSALEVKYYAHPYNNQPLVGRVIRLEQLVFGSAHEDVALAERILQLRKCSGIASPSPTQVKACASPTLHDPANSSKYPRVTELEQAILGQTFEHREIRDRLARLEYKVFGRTSDLDDLSIRVETIETGAYTVVPRKTIAYADSMQVSYHEPDNHFVTVADQIESLEKIIFGSIHANKPLDKRVDSLERNIYGDSRTDLSKNLTTRVAQLWSRMEALGVPARNRPGV